MCNEGGGPSEGRALAREGTKDQRAPPFWTKYLLEEGLDRTTTFAKYRGIFAGEKRSNKSSDKQICEAGAQPLPTPFHAGAKLNESHF